MNTSVAGFLTSAKLQTMSAILPRFQQLCNFLTALVVIGLYKSKLSHCQKPSFVFLLRIFFFQGNSYFLDGTTAVLSTNDCMGFCRHCKVCIYGHYDLMTPPCGAAYSSHYDKLLRVPNWVLSSRRGLHTMCECAACAEALHIQYSSIRTVTAPACTVYAQLKVLVGWTSNRPYSWCYCAFS